MYCTYSDTDMIVCINNRHIYKDIYTYMYNYIYIYMFDRAHATSIVVFSAFCFSNAFRAVLFLQGMRPLLDTWGDLQETLGSLQYPMSLIQYIPQYLIHLCMYIYIYIYMYTLHAHTHTHVCTYIYIYIYTDTYIHIYIYIIHGRGDPCCPETA